MRRGPLSDRATRRCSTSESIARSSPQPGPSVRSLMTAAATVLVLEGDESTQRLLQQTLRSRYRVLTASCWAQAHEIRARASVDAMVVDVKLTSGDQQGLDALCAEAGKTPFVLIAGSPDESPFAHPRERHPSLFTIRPVQLRELPHTLNDVITNGRVASGSSGASGRWGTAGDSR